MIQRLKSLKGSLFKRLYRSRKGFRTNGRLTPFLPVSEGNILLAERIQQGVPLMVARHGSTELNYVCRPRATTFGHLCGISGFFPNDESLGREFIELYLKASGQIDLLAVWNYRHGRFKDEERLFRLCGPQSALIDLTSLTPFLHEQPWTKVLEGKSVLVVHPFVQTIRKQYHESREKLFQDPEVLPAFKSLELVQAVQSMDGEVKGFNNWFEALEAMCAAIKAKEYDIALIGCGAYGLPLAAFVKSMGKQAIHVGGALQLLFGIKGRRWEDKTYNYHNLYYNKYWVRPDETEIPKNSAKYENSAYW